MTDTDADLAWTLLWDRRAGVLHKLLVTHLYHRRRQRFFDLLDKGTKAATVLLGASLLGESLKQHLPLVAAAISGLGLLALVFGYGDRKQTHKELAESAMQLIAKVEDSALVHLTDSLAGQWEADLSRLNAKEPPTLKTLVVLCERDAATAANHPTHVPLPPWHKRVLADFVA